MLAKFEAGDAKFARYCDLKPHFKAVFKLLTIRTDTEVGEIKTKTANEKLDCLSIKCRYIDAY